MIKELSGEASPARCGAEGADPGRGAEPTSLKVEGGAALRKEATPALRVGVADSNREEVRLGPSPEPQSQSHGLSGGGGRTEAIGEAEVLPQVNPGRGIAGEAAWSEPGGRSEDAVASLARMAGRAAPAIAYTSRGLVRGS